MRTARLARQWRGSGRLFPSRRGLWPADWPKLEVAQKAGDELVHVQRLFQKVRRSESPGFLAVGRIGIARHEDHRDAPEAEVGPNLVDQVQSAHPGESDVEQEEVVGGRVEDGKGLFGGAGVLGLDASPRQRGLNALRKEELVFDHEDSGQGLSHA